MSTAEVIDPVITRSAARLRIAVIVAMVVLGAAIILAWVGGPLGIARVEVREHAGLIDSLTGGTISIILIEIAFFRLTQMLGGIAAGDLFSGRVIRHFRGFAFWLLIVALVGLGVPLIGSLLGSGPHRVALVLDLTKILAVGVTLLLFLLARLLERARRLEDEMREFV
jgi:hypothetical protein